MPHDLNQFSILGTVETAPKLHLSDAPGSGGDFALFSVAAEHEYRKGQECKVERVSVPVIAWNGLARYVAANVRAGSRLYVTGRMRYRLESGVPELVAASVIPHGDAPTRSQDGSTFSK